MYTGRSCWLCGRNGTAEPLDKHHIFGGAYRKKSEKYGLTVYLCHGSCHIFGEKAVHSCRETMDELHRYGQKMAMERMGWTKEDFMREFGRNYLDEEDLQPTEEKPTGSFQILDEELCVNWGRRKCDHHQAERGDGAAALLPRRQLRPEDAAGDRRRPY